MTLELKFTKGPLHVVDQGPDKFPIVCGEDGPDAWVAIVNCGPHAVANARLFAICPDLFAEADRSHVALETAAALLAIAWPAHARTMREQAAALAKVMKQARGQIVTTSLSTAPKALLLVDDAGGGP